MTKAAITRRQCRRAKATLMRRWPKIYTEDRFEDSEGWYKLADGTPLLWYDCGDGEADCRPAVEELRDVLMVEATDWERLGREMETRQRFAAMKETNAGKDSTT